MTVNKLQVFLDEVNGQGGGPIEAVRADGGQENEMESPIGKLKRRFTVEEVAGSDSELTRELKLYQKFLEPKPEESILTFWRKNQVMLPLLSQAARYVLAVPCSSSSVERVFSTGGLLVTNRRTSLATRMVEVMVLMRSNIGKMDVTGIYETGDEDIDEISTDSSEDEVDNERVNQDSFSIPVDRFEL